MLHFMFDKRTAAAGAGAAAGCKGTARRSADKDSINDVR